MVARTRGGAAAARRRFDRNRGRRSRSGAQSEQKAAAFERIYWALRARPEPELLETVAALAGSAGVSSAAIAADLFMDWDEAAAFARHPLVAAGAHSRRHRMLAKWPQAEAHEEMAGSKAALEARFGVAVDAFAYPVGDRTSAGPREFALARETGFACAVTTRPGMLYGAHAAHLWALPRSRSTACGKPRAISRRCSQARRCCCGTAAGAST